MAKNVWTRLVAGRLKLLKRRPLGDRGPRHYINIMILQSGSSGIPLLMGVRTRIQDPYVYLLGWEPKY